MYDTQIQLPPISRPTLTGAALASIGIQTDPLNGKRYTNIPGYGIVSAQVLTQHANRWGPEQYFVKTWDSPALCTSESGPYATKAEADDVATAYVLRAIRQEG